MEEVVYEEEYYRPPQAPEYRGEYPGHGSERPYRAPEEHVPHGAVRGRDKGFEPYRGVSAPFTALRPLLEFHRRPEYGGGHVGVGIEIVEEIGRAHV